MSNFTGEEGSFSSGNTGEEVHQHEKQQLQGHLHGSNSQPSSTINDSSSTSQQQPVKKKRNLPGTPDPNAEVVALSPTTLMARNRFVCEICNKGFQRDQNLQLHRRGHNLPWKLRQRQPNEAKKRVYICPEPTCVHHNPARALGDLTGIKKHYSRKHGEKKWKCDKCSKKYAVQSDWKAHQKTCGTREYKCDCGTIFSRRDSFITHRAFCDALAEENNKVNQGLHQQMPNHDLMPSSMPMINTNTSSSNSTMFLNDFNPTLDSKNPLKSLPQNLVPMPFKPNANNLSSMSVMSPPGMFSTTSGTLFGSLRGNTISSSSSLQLSSNTTSSGFNYLQEAKAGGGGLLAAGSASSAHMSATALLQKAAQMGASASNSINSPMMHQKSCMAGPDQQQQQQQPQLIPIGSAPPLPIRPSSMSPYSISNVPHQHPSNNMDTASFNHHPHHGFQSPPLPHPDQFNPLLQKSNRHDHHHNPMTHVMESANAMMSSEMGMFSSMFVGGTDHHNMKSTPSVEFVFLTCMNISGHETFHGEDILSLKPAKGYRACSFGECIAVKYA
ncbi:LOW QUALITY PROTEIN: zinc finger protein GAI-ASSOCIATED FACTOR 1 [Eucalyptus grandis]|uniref:LOW QUALITY PROTEIN: zinc finger protein GAI-ASSOCIATED FACTOR 1 n=1 Tax=Eucalyptus grandis TaxID=71139 RepID=UPI00192EA95D|nr:LOW QUALITY PROTEIN: zinc finger protein GAI-ASSOCIATED FACTOR 1 [Eucalyptus grandis]